MDLINTVAEARALGLLPQAFTVGDVLRTEDPFLSPIADHDALRSALLAEPRFVFVEGRDGEEDRFVEDGALFRLLRDLNLRLASVHKHALSDREAGLALSSLRKDEGWHTVPRQIVQWARSLGLVSACRTCPQYVFPLARLLDRLPETSAAIAVHALNQLGQARAWDLQLAQLLEGCVHKGFEPFERTIIDIVQAREGLLTGSEMTLAETGALVGLSPERVRQREGEFWRRLAPGGRGREATRAPFVAALVCSFVAEKGSLIVRANSQNARLRLFLAKCTGIPHVSLREHGMVVLAVQPEDIACLHRPDWFPDGVHPDAIARQLESEAKLPLVDSDVEALAASVGKWRRARLKTSQRVFLALRAIGEPAHYSQIAEIHNSIFPERATSVRNIHAALARGEHGIVWIGVKGTYALEEWGYERPTETLFETVAQIVAEKYAETGRPVPLAVIGAEMAKHRAVVKPASVSIAAYCNDQVHLVQGDCFVPREVAVDEEEPSDDGLDRVLREFRQAHASPSPEKHQADPGG